MRSAMAMIELIFAIVIIAISILTIPSMLSVAEQVSKVMIIDEDILKRMMGEITKVSQSRWDENSTAPEFRPLRITGDMECDRMDGEERYRRNPDSRMVCSNAAPAMLPAPVNGDLNLSRGIEQLHNRNYNLEINATGGAIYTIPIAYNVSYVRATLTNLNNGIGTATWTLGSSTNVDPADPADGTQTHLKRIVVRTNKLANPDVDMTLTFFKSNVGKFSE